MPSMDTSSTRLSVTSSVVASISFSMQLPFAPVGSTTDPPGARIWHLVPNREGLVMDVISTRPGRRRSTTPDHIAEVALDLFTTYGFSEVSVDDVAVASGIARRTLFRYYSSKNAIPWGDFDAHLRHFAAVLDGIDGCVPLRDALRAGLLDFNSFDDFETDQHRRRMRLILQTAELQAYSTTMYTGWRTVVAQFVARRLGDTRQRTRGS